MTSLRPKDRLVVALDLDDGDAALALAAKIAPEVGAVKVGLELVHAAGLDILNRLRESGLRVFYDAKLHDIPNTVAGAVRAAAKRGLWMINLHASGGSEMMEAAVAAARQAVATPPLLIGVTVLTSLDEGILRDELGIAVPPAEQVGRLAKLAEQAGLDGVVASALEAPGVRAFCRPDFVIVTPGVRPAGAPRHDQRRVATPREALELGADYLVVGRPITRAPDPVAACRAIVAELGP